MKTLKIISLSLLTAMLASAAISCAAPAKENTPADNGETTALTETLPEETTKLVYKSDIPDGTDYGNADFNIYTFDTSNGTWYDVDFAAEGETGDILNDACYQRMRAVEEAVKVKINDIPMGGSGDAGKLKTSVSANAGAYHCAFVNTFGATSCSQSGYLIDLNRLESLDLTSPWWDQNCVNEMTIMNRLYMLTGDIETMYKKSIGVLLFNKQMVEDYNLESPYTLVTDMKWTIDKFTTMCAQVSEDLNGDGKYDMSDKYGLLYYCDIISLGLVGAGIDICSKDDDDIPYPTFYNDNTQKIWEAYTALLFDNTLSLSWSKLGKTNDEIIAMFQANQGLFNFNEFHSIENMRKMDTDFGILPMPLYSEGQSSYHHIINPHVASMLTVPMDCPDTEMTGIVLDALGAESKNVLTPAYNEVYLKTKGTRDDDSEAVLDIVFSTLKYDVGYLYNWGNIGTFTLGMVDGYKTDLSSSYTKIEKSINTAMQKAIDAYAGLD